MTPDESARLTRRDKVEIAIEELEGRRPFWADKFVSAAEYYLKNDPSLADLKERFDVARSVAALRGENR